MSISVSNATLAPGENASVRIRIENRNGQGNNRQTVTVRVSTSFGELNCTQRCDSDVDVDPGEAEEITAQVTAGNVADGQTKSGQVIVQATTDGEQPVQVTRAMAVRGKQVQAPPAVETVKAISGKVTNQSDGKGVNNAYVALQDGAGKLHEDFADSKGNFRFEGSAQKPIAPGRITIGVQLGEKQNTKSLTVNANGTASGVVITLQLAVEPTTSASAVPTEAPLDEEPTEDTPSDTAIAAAPAGNSEDGGGFGNWLVVLGGGLLVAFGVGGIVWVMLRRKENDDPDDETSSTGVRPAMPMGGAAGYRGNDATRIAGAGGAISDAPTMLHSRAPMDEFPDPYGAPMPPQAPTYGGGQQPGWGGAGAGYGGQATQAGGYDQATQMYNAAPPTQFGNAPGSGGGYGAGGYPDAPGSGSGGYGGAPSSGGGYGAAPGGYPPAGGASGGYGERFDEPTGRYEPASGGGYGQPGGRDAGYGQPAPGGYDAANGYADERGYGAEPNGYDQGGGAAYGGAPRGGYDQGQGGYEGGGYGAAPAGGYDQTRGYPAGGGADYDRGGYEAGPPPGYDRVPEQRGGNYGGPNGGYGDQGDYYQGQGQDPAEGRNARHGADGGRDRRQLGWLDD